MQGDSHAQWGYSAENGPETWGKTWPIAEDGQQQSPIDLSWTAKSDQSLLNPRLRVGFLFKYMWNSNLEYNKYLSIRNFNIYFYHSPYFQITGGLLEFNIENTGGTWKATPIKGT